MSVLKYYAVFNSKIDFELSKGLHVSAHVSRPTETQRFGEKSSLVC